MKTFRKSRLTAAVGAATLALTALSPSLQAGALDIAANDYTDYDLGDTLIFPIYTIANGVGTTYSISNTSSRALVIKVRMREQQYSMDVWDSLVFLSPYDHIDLIVQASTEVLGTIGEGDEATTVYVPQVNIVPAEDSCTWNWNGSKNVFPDKFNDSPFNGPEGKAGGRWSVGHVEVIAMADLTEAFYDYGNVLNVSLLRATELKGQVDPLYGASGCTILKTAFSNATNVGNIKFGRELASGPAADAPNALMGRYLIDASGAAALEAGDVPIVLRDTFDTGFLVPQSSALCSSYLGDDNLPLCTSTYAWDKSFWDHPHLGDIKELGIYNAADLAEARVLSGDWSNNKANFVGSDWIITGWDKYAYLDRRQCDPTNAFASLWCNVTPPDKEEHNNYDTTCKPVGTTSPYGKGIELGGVVGSPKWVSVNTGSGPNCSTPLYSGATAFPMSCMGINIAGWDIDEEPATGATSPGMPFSICNEVEVFTFGTEVAVGAGEEVDVRPSLIQYNVGPYARTVVPFEVSDEFAPTTRGWAQMLIQWPQADPVFTRHDWDYGGATQGQLFMVRNGPRIAEDTYKNNASLVPLAVSQELDVEIVEKP